MSVALRLPPPAACAQDETGLTAAVRAEDAAIAELLLSNVKAWNVGGQW